MTNLYKKIEGEYVINPDAKVDSIWHNDDFRQPYTELNKKGEILIHLF